MPRVALTVQPVTIAGLTPTFSAPTDAGSGGGWSFPNTGDQVIRIKNSGAQRTVTILSPATIGGIAIADPTVTIPATTGDVTIGPFDPSIFNNADGAVYVEVDATTGLTAAALKL
jgi:hypothetical protein